MNMEYASNPKFPYLQIGRPKTDLDRSRERRAKSYLY